VSRNRETLEFEAPDGTLRKVPKLRYGGLASAIQEQRDDGKDDPGSPNFVPLEQRDERARARFWALYGKRKRKDHGVFDP
jgi:hypothetical protein